MFVAFLMTMQWVGLAVASDELAESYIYAKCHALITSQPVELDDPVYIAVKDGQKSALRACEELLDLAAFTRSSESRRLVKNTEKARSIVATFHQLHSSWFTSIMAPSLRRSYTQVDHTEPALFITDSLFSGRSASSIVTANYGLRGLRSGGGSSYFISGKTDLSKQRYVIAPMKVSSSKDPKYKDIENFSVRNIIKRVSLGDLIGVQKSVPLSLPASLTYYKPAITSKDYPSLRESKKTLLLNEHFGAGALGSAGSFMNNSELTTKGDGGQHVHRRWANNFFADLMCAELPSLTVADIKPEANKYKGSKLGFRRSSSCLTCHATLDNFAHTGRNIAFTLTANTTFRNFYRDLHSKDKSLVYHSARFPKRFDVKVNAQVVSDDDSIYHRRRPDGKLWYRDFDGRLIKKNVSGLSQLGAEVAKQDDMYVCLAKRYYKYFTGVDVPLYGVDQSNQFAVEQRKNVISYGRSLKKHKSLKKLIIDILGDEAFRTRNPSVLAGEGL